MLTEKYDPVEIGKRIRQLRAIRNLTVHQLASRAEVSAGYVSEIERGLSAISVDKLMQIARALEVGMDRLISATAEATLTPPEVVIPAALSEAAEKLHLSHRVTMTLLQGQRSLTARRAASQPEEWGVKEWEQFYQQVKEFLPE